MLLAVVGSDAGPCQISFVNIEGYVCWSASTAKIEWSRAESSAELRPAYATCSRARAACTCCSTGTQVTFHVSPSWPLLRRSYKRLQDATLLLRAAVHTYLINHGHHLFHPSNSRCTSAMTDSGWCKGQPFLVPDLWDSPRSCCTHLYAGYGHFTQLCLWHRLH